MSPFEALYGSASRQMNLPTIENTSVEAVREFFKSREVMNIILNEAIKRAQDRYKQQADKGRYKQGRYKQQTDKGRSEREFNEGDWVYLKLHPYREHSVALRHNHKLSSKFYGPFLITQKISKVAYKLNLPPQSLIHPVFHVSLLKKKVGAHRTITKELPMVGNEGQLMLQPMAILKRRTVKRNNRAVPQLLIQWASTAPDEATWEDAAVIDAHFPEFLP